MIEFITHYAEAFALFEKYGFKHPVIYRKVWGINSSKVHIEVIAKDIEEELKLKCLQLLCSALKKYFTCSYFLCVKNTNLPESAEKNQPDFFLSFSLPPHLTWTALEQKLVEIFGRPWVSGGTEDIELLQKLTFSAGNGMQWMTSLKIDRLQLSDEIVSVLSEIIKSNLVLKQLSLSTTHLSTRNGRKVTHALRYNSSLTFFDISNNQIAWATEDFSQLLSANHSLQQLYLGENSANYHLAEGLAIGLPQNHTVTHLDLSGCLLGDELVHVFLQGLFGNTTLTVLNLYNNRISSVGVADIAALLSANFALRSLNLGDNNFDITGMNHLCNALMVTTTLQHLGLKNTRPTQDHLRVLKTTLENHTYLTSLDVEIEKGNKEQAKLIGLMLGKNTSLRTVDLGNSHLKSAIARILATSLRKNHTLTTLKYWTSTIKREYRDEISLWIERNQKIRTVVNRQEFIFILILLNQSSSLWKSLPLDIKLHILNFLDLTKEQNIGKNKAQVYGCARFLFWRFSECHSLIKAKQKIIILESTDPQGHCQFRFFKECGTSTKVTNEDSKEKPNMKNFVEHYAEAWDLFQKNGFGNPLIHRSLTTDYSGKVLFLITDSLTILHQAEPQYKRISKLEEELKIYLACEFRLLTVDDYETSYLEKLSFPYYPSFLLTPDLPINNLVLKLVEVFGEPWVFGHSPAEVMVAEAGIEPATQRFSA